MRNLSKMLSITLLTSTIVSCASSLPADFPTAPTIDLCSPVLVKQVYDKSGQPIQLPQVVYDKAGHPFELIPSYVVCSNTGNKAHTSRNIDGILFGVNKDDWVKGQNFKTDVETWAIEHAACKK